MRYLIVSDIHANLEALTAVLDHSQGRYERALCCGDLVGYGADPNEITDWVRASCQTVIRGNHDKASVGLDDLEWFNPIAKQAAIWTRDALRPDNLAYLYSLPHGPVAIENFELAHGSPMDEDEYTVSSNDADQAFEYLSQPVGFIGHTHIQGGFILNHNRVETLPRMGLFRDRDILKIDPECAYILNPGSVGQPRDGDPRAAYLIYDTGDKLVEYYRVNYDIATAQQKIRERGLPAVLADRLSLGR